MLSFLTIVVFGRYFMKNFDLMCIAVIVLLIGLAIYWSNKHPAAAIRDTVSPLPSGLYTNGTPRGGNSNEVLQRVNFQQQPVGNNFS